MRLLLIIAMLLGLAGPALAQDHPCAGAVSARMTELGITTAQIKRTVFIDVTDNGCCNFIVGYEAWVDLKQCKGSVVSKLSRRCEVEESYSRGACDIKGLRNYR